MRKKKYWSNVLAMLGVAMIAAAFFSKDGWFWGMALGVYSLYKGSVWYEEDK